MKLHDLIIACDKLTDGRQTFPYRMLVFIRLMKKDSSEGSRKPCINIGDNEYHYFSDVGDLDLKERYLVNFLSRLSERISLDSEDWIVEGYTLDEISECGRNIAKIAKEIKKGLK